MGSCGAVMISHCTRKTLSQLSDSDIHNVLCVISFSLTYP